ncbi:uncharacterized protein JCM15063_003074 [Sporobolomyces koalae]|uniref:uncharacterized protein n=1 Tax=Sporobolomyces koalae TaxID=500713 RepID=UPI00317EF256
MSSSLSEACNAPKHHYDTCFNHWLKSYLLLVAPPLSNPSDTPAGIKERENRTRALQDKKDELETKCGRQYREYQKCLSTAIKGVEGLPELLAGARREEPLDGWSGIKLTTEEDDALTSQVIAILNSTLPTFEKYIHHASLLANRVKQSDSQVVQYARHLLANPTLEHYLNKSTDFVLAHLPYAISLVCLLLHLGISQLAHSRRTRHNHSKALQLRADMTDHYGLGTFARNAVEGLTGSTQQDSNDFGVVEVQWGREKIRVPLPPPASPLSALKAALYNITGVPPSHQKLIYSGAVLKDDLAPMTAFGLVDEDAQVAASPANGAQGEGSTGRSKSFWDSWSFTGSRNSSTQKIKKLVMLGSKDVSARVDDRLSNRKDLQDLRNAENAASGGAAGGGPAVEEKKVESEEVISKRIKQISTEKLQELEPQVTQVEGWIATRKEEQQAAKAGTAENDAEPASSGAKGGPPPRILLYLSEILLQGLLKLDSIEIPSGYEAARKERKEAVKQVQDVLDRVDRAKEDWKKSGLS